MTRVAPIKLQYNPKTLWFDPQDIEIHCGDPVVVKTARGTEFGHAASDIIEVAEKDIKKLKTELKPVVRIATPDDENKAAELQVKSDEALPIFKEFAAEANDIMRPVSVDFLFDGDKAVFYFEAEERVDFRELVRRLASHFHVRVDMRQVGVRDEARMIGGIGHCGQELCCKRLGGEFCPVSIRMAKEQDLSLNPQKISGVCGRLMCCLRYEYDVYKEFKSRAPKQNAVIDTPEGPAKVVELDGPREQVSLKLPDARTITVPLNDMEFSKEGNRPDTVGEEAFERATNLTVLTRLGDASMLTADFSGVDRLGDAVARQTGNGKSKSKHDGEKESAGSGHLKGGKQQTKDTRKPRRRRTHVDADGSQSAGGTTNKATDPGAKSGGSKKKKQASGKDQQNRKPRKGKRKPEGHPQDAKRTSDTASAKKPSASRVGQKSSGLRHPPTESEKQQNSGDSNTYRKVRRRSHQAGSGGEGSK